MDPYLVITFGFTEKAARSLENERAEQLCSNRLISAGKANYHFI